jgi:hypothetical protein
MDERRTALGFVGPDAAPLLLHTWWAQGEVGDDALRAFLTGVWKGVEFPLRSLKRSLWLDLFTAAGFVAEPAGLERPVQALEVYRGAAPSHARGLSWTTDRKRAAAFAEAWPPRGGRAAAVYQTEAPPEAVMAIIQVGKSRDVIVEPSLIAKLRRL